MATLAAALQQPITLDDVTPWIRFDEAACVQSVVANGRTWELRLHCWRPGHSSALHAHEHSARAFRVVRGTARETMLGERDRFWGPGAVVAQGATALVHQIGNAGDDPLVTLHAYSPPRPVDVPADRGGRNIVIVGGGFSGVAVALHLLRKDRLDQRLCLVEKGPWIGRGLAYGVDSKVFRLNVPASRMSVDPDDPLDFVRWSNVERTPNAFLSRSEFARYVTDRFGEAVRRSRGTVRIVRGEATHLTAESVALSDGTLLPADAVVLAMGLVPRLSPSGLRPDPRIIDAWDERALAALPARGDLLILGSGLTAIDVVSYLAAREFSGRVEIVSRRGLLPRPHVEPAGRSFPMSPIDSATLRLTDLIRWMRRQVADAQRLGLPWQSVMDAVRPHTSAMWRRLSDADRVRFVRSVRPYWDVLRHRAPQDVHALVQAWQEAGKLELRSGAIQDCVTDGAQLRVTLRGAGGSITTHRYDAVIRCIGPSLERSETETPLIRSLIDSGRACPDPAGLGIVTTADGHVVPAGSATPALFAIGAVRRASNWETTAVPEIAVHAARLADQLS